jgi:hypothetical protein
MGFDYGQLTAVQVAASNAVVAQINALIASEAQSDPRIHMVATDQAFRTYDFKTNPNARTVQIDGKVLSNVMIQESLLPLPGSWRGGLMGLDGMHPSVVGYAIMAQAILDSIHQYEGIVAQHPIDLAAAYRADSLLTDLPETWEPFFLLQRETRRLTGDPPKLANIEAGLASTTLQQRTVAGLFEMLRYPID